MDGERISEAVSKIMEELTGIWLPPETEWRAIEEADDGEGHAEDNL